MVITQFNRFYDELCQCDWYLYSMEMQKMYSIFLKNSQQPAIICGYANILCTREVFKKVCQTADWLNAFIKINVELLSLITISFFRQRIWDFLTLWCCVKWNEYPILLCQIKLNSDWTFEAQKHKCSGDIFRLRNCTIWPASWTLSTTENSIFSVLTTCIQRKINKLVLLSESFVWNLLVPSRTVRRICDIGYISEDCTHFRIRINEALFVRSKVGIVGFYLKNYSGRRSLSPLGDWHLFYTVDASALRSTVSSFSFLV